jgi:hypothetical protein
VRRRLFNLAAAVSLVLCVGLIVVSLRSFLIVDMISWERCTLSYPHQDPQNVHRHIVEGRLGFGRGGFSVEVTTQDGRLPRDPRILPYEMWSHSSSAGPTYAPFKYTPRVSGWVGYESESAGPDSNGAASNSRAVWFPAVFPIALAAVLPCLWLLPRRGRFLRAWRKGICPTCGYDLRGTPERCPECGATPGEPPHNRHWKRTGTASSDVVQ